MLELSEMQKGAVVYRCLPLILGLLVPSLAPAQAPAPAADSADRAETSSPPAEILISDRVILVRDPQMRQTHFTLVVHAGCLDEETDCRGIAHYLEHLLLVGRNPEHTESAFRFFSDGYANGWT